MFKIICVTNRNYCKDDFIERLKLIGKHADAIILREKDLLMADEEPFKKYSELAKKVADAVQNTEVILHTDMFTAFELNKRVHLTMSLVKFIPIMKNIRFGASCHSVEDVLQAEKMGCEYVTLGNIFDTDCKEGEPGKGIELLRNAVQKATVPVYAIGGINNKNIGQVAAAGASGACVMSGAMMCKDVDEYFGRLKDGLN